MIYLSGVARPELAGELDMGYMLTFQMRNVPALLTETTWAADNCCFSQKRGFDELRWRQWLTRMRVAQSSCLFAVAPDVVADAAATLERSRPHLGWLHRQGWRVAYVAQDGWEDVPPPWDDFDALFLGGTTGWKLSIFAAQAVRDARERGKWVHMGRVNSRKRMQLAKAFGCDSCDGTFLKYAPTENIGRLRRWFVA